MLGRFLRKGWGIRVRRSDVENFDEAPAGFRRYERVRSRSLPRGSTLRPYPSSGRSILAISNTTCFLQVYLLQSRGSAPAEAFGSLVCLATWRENEWK
jgi:hypothetical protein